MFVGEGFVQECLDRGVQRCYVINVYAKCNLDAKRRLWDSLVKARRSLGEGCGVF